MEDELVPSAFYEKGITDRSQYETRAENIAKVSLPYLIRASGSSGSTKMNYGPSQSFNGMLINNLKAKLGMALLPPRTSSFRFAPNQKELLELTGGDTSMNAKIQQELSYAQDRVNAELEIQQIRSSIFDFSSQLIAVGPVILEKVPEKGITIHTLKNIVVDLDNQGEPLVMCFVETLKYLPEGITVDEEKDEYELYTMAKYDSESDKWIVTQDIDGVLVGDELSYTRKLLPFKYLGWTWMPGDSYHRPFAEDYYDDMVQVNNLSKLNTAGAVAAAKLVILVNQRGGRTKKSAVADAENGAIIDGDAADITAFQLAKNYDFQVSNEREMEIKRTLQKCFLDAGSVTRNAERVTATEIDKMSEQLEASTLAGIYSKMSLSFSKWIVEMVMDELNIKFESIETDVLTGMDALGRSSEAQKLDAYVQRTIAVGIRHYLKDEELLTRYASYDSISTIGLVKTAQEVQKEQKAAQDAAQQQELMMSGAKSLGDNGAKAAMENKQGMQ